MSTTTYEKEFSQTTPVHQETSVPSTTGHGDGTGLSLPHPTEVHQAHQEHLPSASTTASGAGVPHVGPTLTQPGHKEGHAGDHGTHHIAEPSAHRPETSSDKALQKVPKLDPHRNYHYIYNKQPTGDQFSDDVFRFEEIASPREPSTENEILVRLTYISIDPFIRNRMSEKKEFIQPFKLNDVLEGEATAEIVKSNNPKYPVGQSIVGYLNWTTYQIINVKNLPVNIIPKDIHPSYYLSIFGLPGLTAYFGLTEYAKLKPQNSMLVSGACGSVGLFVSQIARILGCNRLVGLDSNEDKVNQSILFGYNQSYVTNPQELDHLLTTAFPDGIDVYWDNVGGPILDTVIEHMRPHGRIILCGTMSECGTHEKTHGIKKFDRIIAKSLTVQGLFCAEFSDRFPKAYKKLLHWYHEGKIKTKETTLEGFQHIPEAFSSLFSGKTLGKTLVHVEPAQVA